MLYRVIQDNIQGRSRTKAVRDNGVFPKLRRTFIEFREFGESDKSLKHELG